jgi:Domain of unknown function (DUF4136)
MVEKEATLKTLKHALTLTLFLLAIGTAVPAQTVKVNWQASAPFADYRTYAWQTNQNEPNSFYDQWVKPDVDAQLASKHLSKITADQKPDLIVVYHLKTQELMDATTTSDGFGWGSGGWGMWGGWGGWGDETGFSTTSERPRTMAILTVDLGDAKKKELVWRGQATVESVSSSQKGDEKQVAKSVEKMFKQFPPPSR